MGRGADRASRSARRPGTDLERLILDTSVLIAAERGTKVSAAIDDDDDVAIAAITAAELMVGVELASPARRAARGTFVEDLLSRLPIEPYGLPTARAHAVLLAAVRRSGRPRGAHDLLIAATAMASGRLVITHDESGFRDLEDVRVRVL